MDVWKRLYAHCLRNAVLSLCAGALLLCVCDLYICNTYKHYSVPVLVSPWGALSNVVDNFKALNRRLQLFSFFFRFTYCVSFKMRSVAGLFLFIEKISKNKILKGDLHISTNLFLLEFSTFCETVGFLWILFLLSELKPWRFILFIAEFFYLKRFQFEYSKLFIRFGYRCYE